MSFGITSGPGGAGGLAPPATPLYSQTLPETASRDGASARTASARNPYHTRGGIETLDYLQAKLDRKGFEAFLVGKIHQRLHRAYTLTGQESRQDYAKASWYMGRLLRYLTQTVGPDPSDLDALSNLDLNRTGPDAGRRDGRIEPRYAGGTGAGGGGGTDAVGGAGSRAA